jgi:DNA replication protein DnaC
LTAGEIRSSNWSDIKVRENVTEATQAIQDLLEYGNGLGYLYGGAGLAKTKVLQIACAEWARAGRGIFHFTTQKDILDQMRTAYDDEPQRRILEMQNKFIAFPLLAIDELTTERSTEFKVEQFFHIVNKRHEAGTERGEGFITIMAGNIAPHELDFRITDRLTDGRNFIVQLTGESFRPHMQRGMEK